MSMNGSVWANKQKHSAKITLLDSGLLVEKSGIFSKTTNEIPFSSVKSTEFQKKLLGKGWFIYLRDCQYSSIQLDGDTVSANFIAILKQKVSDQNNQKSNQSVVVNVVNNISSTAPQMVECKYCKANNASDKERCWRCGAAVK